MDSRHEHGEEHHCHDHANRNDDEEERLHFQAVCEAYRQYAPFAMAQLTNRQYRLQALPDSHRQYLPPRLTPGNDVEKKAATKAFRDATIRNQFCLDCILRHAGQPHSQQQAQNHHPPLQTITDDQISKVSSVLKSLARDWSKEGKQEREAAYLPIKTLVQKYLPNNTRSPTPPPPPPPRICVPGSGVGRLAFDLRERGYSVQGNDFSLYMLLGSDFILNNGGICNPERPLSISPWLLESRNRSSWKNELRTVHIPDVDPMALFLSQQDDSSIDFSMAAGEFNAIYSHPKEHDQWDCVTSCFFLDACPNMIETLRVIYNMLRPGGFLIHLGPLLYHFSGPSLRPDDGTWQRYRDRYSHLDELYMTSIDLAYDDVREILVNIGFEILEEERDIECYYTADALSMMTTQYRCVSFVARKKQGQRLSMTRG
jgi:carnosine N-methyltransferase